MTDRALAILILLFLSPILIIISLLLKVTGEGKIFYIQRRVGKCRVPFGVIKFATMLENSPNMEGGLLTQREDPRVLPLGKFLRRYKINEVPQLLNIAKGEMRFVGPRPISFEHFSMYPSDKRYVYDELCPGLTGVGSLVFRDEESVMADCGEDPLEFYRSEIMPYKAALEEWYLQRRTWLLDCKVIVLTAAKVVGLDWPFNAAALPVPSDSLQLLLKPARVP